MEKIILFDGTSADKWQMLDGSPCNWPIENGELVVGDGNLVTKENFQDFLLHVEFKCPSMPEVTGRNKGNSGVYLHGCYEIQILDTIDSNPPIGGDCGAVYQILPPMVNASLPAEHWQTYDIWFRAPRYDENNEITEYPRITMMMNGLPVHSNDSIPHVTPGGLYDHIVSEGPFMLQDHGHQLVRFRNIWVMPIADTSVKK